MNPLKKELTPLISALEELAHWQGIGALLSWDQETYMPEGAIDSRSDQTALVAKITHQKVSNPSFRALLSDWVDLDSGKILSQDVTPLEARLLKEVHRDWKFSTALPEEFVETLAKTKAQSQHEWQKARKNNDFKAFQPYLEKVVSLTAQKALYLNPKAQTYDALLDEYEPDLTLQELDPVLKNLKQETLAVLAETRTIQKEKFPIKDKTWDPEKQWQFSLKILTDMGFDFEKGRLDKSTHPFSTQIHPTDVRITTRIHPHDFLEGLSSTIHECGHALYEQGLPSQYFGTPLCSAISFGIHESQSRFWENGVGKSRSFWKHYFPLACDLFPENISPSDEDAFINAILEVKPSLVRVQADELTYNIHIFIRYELEKALFSGELKVADLPTAWNEKYKAYLGVTPPTDALGVMQDVHWSCGYFGYFPTYTLGNLYAAMLLDQIQSELHFDNLLATGHLAPIRSWLKTKIHQVGRGQTAQELIKTVTGKELSHEPFIRQMRRKFGD